MFMGRFALLISFATCVHYAVADVSLYIPGFDPQPVTANELGVGADGATTWLIAPGEVSGTLSDYGFYAPATLVLGPSDANLVYIDPSYSISLSESCIIADGTAACVEAFGETGITTVTATNTELAAPFEVQGGGFLANPTPTPSGTDSTPSAGSSSGTPSSGSSSTSAPTGSAGQSSSGSAALNPPASTQKANGGARMTFSYLAFLGIMVVMVGALN
ncbi:hypothetical protein B0H21DRAFT_716023 [Amylocystis lapponica]|nr:hypothetical protein B0H21DRAFT_716023 [Amylocystis lapponica]